MNTEILKNTVAKKLVEALRFDVLPEGMHNKKGQFICSKKNLQELLTFPLLPRKTKDLCEDILFLFSAQGRESTVIEVQKKIEKVRKSIIDYDQRTRTNFSFNELDREEKSLFVPRFYNVDEALSFYQQLKQEGATVKEDFGFQRWVRTETRDEAFLRQKAEFEAWSRECIDMLSRLKEEEALLLVELQKAERLLGEVNAKVKELEEKYGN